MNAKVLVTAVGGIVAQGIVKSLKLANLSDIGLVKYKIIAADMSAQAAGLYRCHHGFLLPSANSPDYIENIVKIAREEHIDAIYVGSDEELLVIGKSKKRIERESRAKVLSSPVEVLTIGRDKWKTYLFLKQNDLPVPGSALPIHAEKFVKEFDFPIVVKPREGYGSLFFHLVHCKSEMKQAISNIQKAGWHPLLQEYLNGDNIEYTSGVTVDRFGKYVMSSISIRKTVKNGQTYKAFIDDYRDVRRSSEEAALKLGGRGSINIQAKLVGNKPKIFEINPRFSATCPMRSAAGINEPDIVFRNFVLGEEIRVKRYRKLVCMRYWNEVYTDFPTYEKARNTGRVGNNDSFTLNYF
ncbi:MAG TPA: ATP-grasp domain-containing protein [Candidatus Bathyarchaeia archaeon]|nr:ATP-grasp domain-containing protein [Candidatus Bathyarchaeia archaeon]